MNQVIPQDIRPCWFNPIRRLQSVVKGHNHGMAIVSVRFLVSETGEPVCWTEPEVTLLEPSRFDGGERAKAALFDLFAR